jgi:hypothetical protein
MVLCLTLSCLNRTVDPKVLLSLSSSPTRKPRLLVTLLMVRISREEVSALTSLVVSQRAMQLEVSRDLVAFKEVPPVVEMEHPPHCLSETLVSSQTKTVSRDTSRHVALSRL